MRSLGFISDLLSYELKHYDLNAYYIFYGKLSKPIVQPQSLISQAGLWQLTLDAQLPCMVTQISDTVIQAESLFILLRHEVGRLVFMNKRLSHIVKRLCQPLLVHTHLEWQLARDPIIECHIINTGDHWQALLDLASEYQFSFYFKLQAVGCLLVFLDGSRLSAHAKTTVLPIISNQGMLPVSTARILRCIQQQKLGRNQQLQDYYKLRIADTLLMPAQCIEFFAHQQCCLRVTHSRYQWSNQGLIGDITAVPISQSINPAPHHYTNHPTFEMGRVVRREGDKTLVRFAWQDKHDPSIPVPSLSMSSGVHQPQYPGSTVMLIPLHGNWSTPIIIGAMATATAPDSQHHAAPTQAIWTGAAGQRLAVDHRIEISSTLQGQSLLLDPSEHNKLLALTHNQGRLQLDTEQHVLGQAQDSIVLNAKSQHINAQQLQVASAQHNINIHASQQADIKAYDQRWHSIMGNTFIHSLSHLSFNAQHGLHLRSQQALTLKAHHHNIKVNSQQHLMNAEHGIHIVCGKSSLILSPHQISLKGKNITVNAKKIISNKPFVMNGNAAVTHAEPMSKTAAITQPNQHSALQAMIALNFRRPKAPDAFARELLKANELAYFKQHNNTVNFFVHGFAVEYGCFGVGFKHHQDVLNPLAFLKQKNINGSGAHNWWLHMEDNINRSAGRYDAEDFSRFLRLCHIAWPGDTQAPWDYMQAVDNARHSSQHLIKVILQCVKTGLNINIIAHSLGCYVTTHALQQLAEHGHSECVNQVVLWQAAIPNDVFNINPNSENSAQYHAPLALNAVQQCSVLYSYHDNVLGPMPQQENPYQTLHVLYQKKQNPSGGLSLSLLSLIVSQCDSINPGQHINSVYHLANAIGQPVSQLVHSTTAREQLYRSVQQRHHRYDNQPFPSALSQHLQWCIHTYPNLINYLSSVALVARRHYWPGFEAFLKARANQIMLRNEAALMEQIFGLDSLFQHLWYVPHLDHPYIIPDTEANEFAALMIMIFVTQNLKIAPALGYTGPAIEHPKIISLDQSNVLYTHSGMKTPSRELQQQVYEAFIVRQLGIVQH